MSFRQLFAYPFRIFFLSLAVLAVIAVPLWLWQLMGPVNLPLAMPGFYWHQHEMAFAFLHAGIAGFLLTAVTVWTGTVRLHGLPLMLLWLVWVAGRLTMTLGAELPQWLVLVVNLAFIPLVMLDAGRRLVAAKQWRHLPLLVVLGLLWLMQLGFLLDPAGPWLAGALVLAAALMLIVGGRITPNFSLGWLRARGARTERIVTLPRLEQAMQVSLLLALLAVISQQPMAIVLSTLPAALLSLWRILLWRGWRVRAEPLLWILHLSLLWVPVGLGLLAGSALGLWPENVWVHALGIGAMGGLILGVISRVALGHTGRPLALPAGMISAFFMIQAAALVRVFTALSLLPWMAGVNVSAALWLLAYALFLWRYTRVLASPRVDGKPG